MSSEAASGTDETASSLPTMSTAARDDAAAAAGAFDDASDDDAERRADARGDAAAGTSSDENCDDDDDATCGEPPWLVFGRVDEGVCAALAAACECAAVLGPGCDECTGPSYHFLSTTAVDAATSAAVERAVRDAAGAFDLDWSRHFVSRLCEPRSLDCKFIRYRPGERPPPVHLDVGLRPARGRQVVNALIYLNADFRGGETVLDAASRRPRIVRPKAGKLVLWRSLHYGAEDAHETITVERRALHTARAVTRGEKRVLAMAVRAHDPERGPAQTRKRPLEGDAAAT
ncbi:hypothetical protein M885DRAFT_540650 [Pelagophyceae sp. CCMP2097]|nr:hypothetical protein M885DRAFT_540650 [Pelagophyceae sp. CCMP2097]